MIDVRYGNAKAGEFVFFCPECESKYGATFELRVNYRNRTEEARKLRIKRVKLFDELHDKHEPEWSAAYLKAVDSWMKAPLSPKYHAWLLREEERMAARDDEF